MKKVRVISIAIVLCVLSSSVFAALDLMPAPWRTNPIGQPATTYQSWDFLSGTNPTAPDVDLNPYGTAELTVQGGFNDGTVYYPNGPAAFPADGVWAFENDVTVWIPNNPVPNPHKEIWVQLTYSADAVPNLFILPDGVPYEIMNLVADIPLGNGYNHAVYHVAVSPNPSFEIAVVRPAECVLYVDDLIIETICIPEPATMALLGLGGLLLRKKNRI